MDKFKPFFFTNISTCYRKFQVFLNDELHQYEINSSEFPYLLILLFIQDGILQDEMSKIPSITKAATSRALQSLERKGFIYRTESEHSNRHKLVFLLPKALEVKPHVEAAIKKWDDMLLGSLTKEERKTTMQSLEKMSETARKYHPY